MSKLRSRSALEDPIAIGSLFSSFTKSKAELLEETILLKGEISDLVDGINPNVDFL